METIRINNQSTHSDSLIFLNDQLMYVKGVTDLLEEFNKETSGKVLVYKNSAKGEEAALNVLPMAL